MRRAYNPALAFLGAMKDREAGSWRGPSRFPSNRRIPFLGDLVSSTSLISLATQAGWSLADAVTAAAVAMAESNGNPQAYNPETAAGTPPRRGSYGLWQIYLNKHPEFQGWNLYDPAVNAQAAFRVWQQAGGSFSPWTTYTSGAYRSFLSPDSSSPAPLTIDAATGLPIDDSTPTPSVAVNQQVPTWFPMAAGAVGVALVYDLLFG